MGECYVCKQPSTDIRPYGKGGAPICFTCMKADPAREQEAKRQFDKALRGTNSRMVVIGEGVGGAPRAATYAEAVMVEDFLQDAEKADPLPQRDRT